MYTTEQLENGINKKIYDATMSEGQVSLTSEDRKQSTVTFIYGWKLSYNIETSTLGNHYPRISGFRDCGTTTGAATAARESVKDFQSGRNPLYLERLKKQTSGDLAGFAKKDIDLGGSGTGYFGCDNCSSCSGNGKKTCYQCNYGKTSCNYCSGSGSRQEQTYDSNGRSTWDAVSCSYCWGSGQVNCQSCGGSGSLTCQLCHGTGDEYTGYVVRGQACRSTEFSLKNEDCHCWATDFIAEQALDITDYLQNTRIESLTDSSGDYSVSFKMNACLATLEYSASVSIGQTLMKFIGENDTIIDAGCIMDCDVWALAANLGTTGSLTTDKTILAAPVIKELLDCHEQKKQSELMTDNWVSQEISDALFEKYKALVKYLESDNRGKLLPGFLLWSSGIAALLAFITFLTGILIPATVDYYQFLPDGTWLNYFRPEYFPSTWEAFMRFLNYERNWEPILGIAAFIFLVMYSVLPIIHWKKKLTKLEKFITTFLIIWLAGYFTTWCLSLYSAADYGMGRPYATNVEWYMYGVKMLALNAWDLALFSLFFAICAVHRRLWKIKNATIRSYDSEILNRHFKLL